MCVSILFPSIQPTLTAINVLDYDRFRTVVRLMKTREFKYHCVTSGWMQLACLYSSNIFSACCLPNLKQVNVFKYTGEENYCVSIDCIVWYYVMCYLSIVGVLEVDESLHESDGVCVFLLGEEVRLQRHSLRQRASDVRHQIRTEALKALASGGSDLVADVETNRSSLLLLSRVDGGERLGQLRRRRAAFPPQHELNTGSGGGAASPLRSRCC